MFTLLGSFLIFKLIDRKKLLIITGVLLLAIASTLPLAMQYVKFSKTQNASFGITDQAMFSSSVSDYVIPNNSTIIGKAYYKIFPHAQVNSYNLDSYSYHGLCLYVIAIVLFVFYFKKRKNKGYEKDFKLMSSLLILMIMGFVLSLGPLLKIRGDYIYGHGLGSNIFIAIPMPYLIIDKILPQLHFLRAIGRISVLVIFSLCILLGFLPKMVNSLKISKTKKLAAYSILLIAVLIELLPLHLVPMSKSIYSYNLNVPKIYSFISKNPKIDDIIVLQAEEYPSVPFWTARTETILWAGFDNRNTYNGYSGYTPPKYFSQYSSFVNFNQNTPTEMKNIGIKYVIIDKLLYSNKKDILSSSIQVFGNPLYQDDRYLLFKL
jgi:hypothetical protein